MKTNALISAKYKSTFKKHVLNHRIRIMNFNSISKKSRIRNNSLNEMHTLISQKNVCNIFPLHQIFNSI